MVDTFWKRSGYPIWGVDHNDFNFLVTRHGSRWDSQRGQELQYIKLFTLPANPFSTNFAPSSPCANPNNSGTTRFVWKVLEHIQNPIIISVLYCFNGRQHTFFSDPILDFNSHPVERMGSERMAGHRWPHCRRRPGREGLIDTYCWSIHTLI